MIAKPSAPTGPSRRFELRLAPSKNMRAPLPGRSSCRIPKQTEAYASQTSFLGTSFCTLLPGRIMT